jgi:hypothetical protein
MNITEWREGKRHINWKSERTDDLMNDLIDGKFVDYLSISIDGGRIFYIPGALRIQLNKDGEGFVRCKLSWIDIETRNSLIDICNVVVNTEDSFVLESEDSVLVWPFTLRGK